MELTLNRTQSTPEFNGVFNGVDKKKKGYKLETSFLHNVLIWFCKTGIGMLCIWRAVSHFDRV